MASGRANARGVGSYSKVSTVGPATTAPSEQMAAMKRASGAGRGASAPQIAKAIRYRPQMPKARVTICSHASTSRKSRLVAARKALAISSYRVYDGSAGRDSAQAEGVRIVERLR